MKTSHVRVRIKVWRTTKIVGNARYKSVAIMIEKMGKLQTRLSRNIILTRKLRIRRFGWLPTKWWANVGFLVKQLHTGINSQTSSRYIWKYTVIDGGHFEIQNGGITTWMNITAVVSLKSLVSQTYIGSILVFYGIQKSRYIWKYIIINGGHFDILNGGITTLIIITEIVSLKSLVSQTYVVASSIKRNLCKLLLGMVPWSLKKCKRIHKITFSALITLMP